MQQTVFGVSHDWVPGGGGEETNLSSFCALDLRYLLHPRPIVLIAPSKFRHRANAVFWWGSGSEFEVSLWRFVKVRMSKEPLVVAGETWRGGLSLFLVDLVVVVVV